MQGNRLAKPFWGDWFPVQERLLKLELPQTGKVTSRMTLLVDVAGGLGHDLTKFQKKYSKAIDEMQVKELLLQDQPHVIEEIQQKGGLGEGVKYEVYDFFEPQPVKGLSKHPPVNEADWIGELWLGARIYFHHFILHDWDDASCRKILSNTAAAMEPGYSKLILNEIVLPDKGAPLQMALWDMQMMVVLGGRERPERVWRELLSSVGLEIAGIWQPPAAVGGEAIIEAFRKI